MFEAEGFTFELVGVGDSAVEPEVVDGSDTVGSYAPMSIRDERVGDKV